MLSKCKFCKSNAVTFIPHSKMPLCKSHFLTYITGRVKKTIEEYNLIDMKNKNEKILIGLSGGKDSQTLLTILNEIFQKKVKLEALYIEVGIKPRDYSKDSKKMAQKLCKKLDIPFHILNIKKEIGFDIDDIHGLNNKRTHGKRRKKGRFRGECSYCGLIKRYYINKFAYENGYSKVVTGHNLTDEATQLVSNLFNMSTDLMSRAGPSTSTNVEGLITRVKPLYFIYEKEIMLYAYYAKIPHLSTQCKYAVESPMIKVKNSLLEIEKFRRGNLMNVVKKFQKKLRPILSKTIPNKKKIVKKCKECGMTTYLDKCSFCKTKERLKNQIFSKNQ